jgi:hypothetical protein
MTDFVGIVRRIDKLKDEITEIRQIADTQQISKIVQVMERHNLHPIIIKKMNTLKYYLIGLQIIGLLQIIIMSILFL